MSNHATDPGLRIELERLGDRAVPGLVRAHIGGWIVRSGLGATSRANSTWPRSTAGDTVAAVDEVERWYAKVGREAVFMVYADADPVLTAELDRRGYEITSPSIVMIASLADVNLKRKRRLDSGFTIEVADEPGGAMASLVADTDRLTEISSTSLPQRFAVATDHAGAVVGGGAVTIDNDWAGFFAMKTVITARRKGVAGVVLATLIDEAESSGAERGWLQVEAANTGAVALYEGLGFQAVHTYHYRRAPSRSPER